MNINDVLDALADAGKKERSNYHLCLGELISKLETGPYQDYPVVFENGTSPEDPHSYRGYYSDLAFDSSNEQITASNFLEMLKKEVLNKTFEGWKGGDYVMNEKTPIWKSERGRVQEEAVISLEIMDNQFVLKTKKLDL